jgi:acyl-CoA dehydrogenase
MTCRVPINDMLLALNHSAGLQAAVTAGALRRFRQRGHRSGAGSGRTICDRPARAAQSHRDENGIKLDNDKVTTAPGEQRSRRMKRDPQGTRPPWH